MSKNKVCINCREDIDLDREEYNRGYNSNKKMNIFMCEGCDDYSTRNINYWESRKTLKNIKELR
jgi:hypothetical protein